MTNPLERILVVEDEKPLREACQRILQDAGYNVVIAESGEEALAVFQKGKGFDVILTDIRMPGSLDGVALVEIVKQESPMTDVVVMTAVPTVETAIPTLKQGAYDYLIKPFNEEFLLSVIHRCFEKRRLSQDLQRERSLRQELEAAYEELQKVEQLKEAILARLSHELRTPFVSAFFSLDRIESNPNHIEKTTIKMLRSCLDQLWETMQNLLLFSDLQKKPTLSSLSNVSLEGLFKQVIEKYRVQWEAKQLDVEFSADTKEELFEGDSALLETAFKHLLLNAIRFNKKNGHIRISLTHQKQLVSLTIADTGIGIPEDQLSIIFDSFYQVAGYLTREVGGLGLGLAIVRRIVEAHGGRISVTSQQNVGSRFQILFPNHVQASREVLYG